MSREIKFRGWNIASKMYYPVEHFALRMDGVELQLMDIKTMNYIPNNSRGMIYEQYTGLKDKNGVEIYEGDIVKRRSYNDGPYPMRLTDENKHDEIKLVEFTTKTPFVGYRLQDDEEIIGNINENPELLSR